MTPEEVSELSEEEQVYFGLLEEHLWTLPDEPETYTLIEPISPLVAALVWCVVVLIMAAPLGAVAVFIWWLVT